MNGRHVRFNATESTSGGGCPAVALVLALAVCGAATAQFSSQFEPPTYAGSAGGIELNGQDGFYNPDPPNSISALVYTYAGNALGLPVNPDGGEQFVAGTGPAGAVFSRSQRDVDYGSSSMFTITYDFATTFAGKGSTAQNLGSFSTADFAAPPVASTYIHLMQWNDVDNPVSFNARYIAYDAAGVQFPAPYDAGSPGPEWENLLINHWYRATTTFDLDSNRITRVSILDLTTGECATFEPRNWYLGGGAGGGLPDPSGFRFFAGSTSVPGNTLAFDNTTITNCPIDLNGDGTVGAADLLGLLVAWGTDPCGPPDFDGDGLVGASDLLTLLVNWGPCP